MRLIDADELAKRLWKCVQNRKAIVETKESTKEHEYHLGKMSGYYAALKIVDAAPTIDHIVRCGECKYKPTDTGGHNYGAELEFPMSNICPCECGDPWYSWMPQDDWFCADGERQDILGTARAAVELLPELRGESKGGEG